MTTFLKSRWVPGITIIALLSGCATVKRTPSSTSGLEASAVKAPTLAALKAQYLWKQINAVYGTEWKTLDDAAKARKKLPPDDSRLKQLKELVDQWIALQNEQAEALSSTPLITTGTPPARIDVTSADLDEPSVFPIDTRQTLQIKDLGELVLSQNGSPAVDYLVDNIEYDYSLNVENMLPLSEAQKKALRDDPRLQLSVALTAKLSCDHDVKVDKKFMRDVHGKSVEFTLYNREVNGADSSIVFGKEFTNCDLLFKAPGQKDFKYGIHLMSETGMARSKLRGRVRETCLYQQGAKMDNPTDYFNNVHLSGLSCQHAAESTELIDDSYDAFSKKIQAMTGYYLPKSVIQKQDYDHKIDFSKAPHFDFLYLTTLEYKVDFVGKMIAQVLKWHADHGTQVRLVLPGIAANTFDRERNFLDELERYNRNIKVQYYVYHKDKDFFLNLQHLQRVIHSKIVVGVSESDPSVDFVITGGRNIKDTFVMHEVPHYKDLRMTQYGEPPAGEPFIFYHDLEVIVRSETLAKQVGAQIMSFWSRDTHTMDYRPASIHLPVPVPVKGPEGTSVRSIISVPYTDEHQLEDVFAQLIDSAKRKLRIVSPYFRPTKKLARSLRAALDRGVKIDFTTRLNMHGDNSPPITGDVNKFSANVYYDKMNVYDWKENSILHAKAYLVDDEVIFVGGTNFNNRSFYHDVESGMLIRDPNVARKFNEIYDNVYLKQADRITDPQKMDASYSKILVPILGGYF